MAALEEAVQVLEDGRVLNLPLPIGRLRRQLGLVVKVERLERAQHLQQC